MAMCASERDLTGSCSGWCIGPHRGVDGPPWQVPWGLMRLRRTLDEVGLDEAADVDAVELEVAEPPAALVTRESRPARAIALQGGSTPKQKESPRLRTSGQLPRGHSSGCHSRGRPRRHKRSRRRRGRVRLVARVTHRRVVGGPGLRVLGRVRRGRRRIGCLRAASLVGTE